MKKIVFTFLLFCLTVSNSSVFASNQARFWQVQSIDTMKYSRDVARQYLNDSAFDKEIDTQIKAISEIGATHVAIATPYDAEFTPFLSRWVTAARKYHLGVWFRGNLSGWENWFGYEDIAPKEHTQGILEFIKSNSNLFADGDIFTSCPECENGGEGDPRHTRKISEYRQFLISEHDQVRKLFRALNKEVITNYYSMNADVARLIMDKQTTTALGGIVTIDHYVASPEKLAFDVQNIAESSGGQIVLGEWGAPIPDIHGKMSENAQSEWIAKSLELLIKSPYLIGLNYWTNIGGSASIWSTSNNPKLAVETLKSFYSPRQIRLYVKNTADKPLLASINYLNRGFGTDKKGQVNLPWPGYSTDISIQSSGYKSLIWPLDISDQTTYLDPEHTNWWYKLQLLTYRLKQIIMRVTSK